MYIEFLVDKHTNLIIWDILKVLKYLFCNNSIIYLEKVSQKNRCNMNDIVVYRSSSATNKVSRVTIKVSYLNRYNLHRSINIWERFISN